MRCLEPATAEFDVDAREVHQPGAGDEELQSPYVGDDELDLPAWARDALALALPGPDRLPARLRRPVPALRREPQRGPGARARARARPALVEALRAQVRLADKEASWPLRARLGAGSCRRGRRGRRLHADRAAAAAALMAVAAARAPRCSPLVSRSPHQKLGQGRRELLTQVADPPAARSVGASPAGRRRGAVRRGATATRGAAGSPTSATPCGCCRRFSASACSPTPTGPTRWSRAAMHEARSNGVGIRSTRARQTRSSASRSPRVAAPSARRARRATADLPARRQRVLGGARRSLAGSRARADPARRVISVAERTGVDALGVTGSLLRRLRAGPWMRRGLIPTSASTSPRGQLRPQRLRPALRGPGLARRSARFGELTDTAVTQASAVLVLRRANPALAIDDFGAATRVAAARAAASSVIKIDTLLPAHTPEDPQTTEDLRRDAAPADASSGYDVVAERRRDRRAVEYRWRRARLASFHMGRPATTAELIEPILAAGIAPERVGGRA